MHPSNTIWKNIKKNPENFDQLSEKIMYFNPDWQQEKFGWKRDFVWVQKYTLKTKSRQNKKHCQNGRLVGQLFVTVTILNKKLIAKHSNPLKYVGNMVATRKFRNGGKFHDIHGMLETRDTLL